jgi:alkylation response protein AidB-like acyl-CoA dehydrogenase
MVDSCVFYEEISRGDSGIAVALACTTWSLIPILMEPYRRPNLLKELTQVFHEDEIHFGCFAMTEPDAGCDIENPSMQGRKIRTRARLDGDEWVINGAKQWPSNAGIASLYLTVCTTDPDRGDDGIALIYVPYPIKGVTFGKFENKAGMQTDRNCTIYFDDVRVPKRYRAAGPGDDAKLLHQNLVIGSEVSAAMSVGTAQSIFELVTVYTTERVVAGKPIKEHSVNACALADMAIGIETARTYTLNVAHMLDHPETYGPRWSKEMLAKARIAKVYAADVSVMVANKAMEMMGSFGYTKEADVEKQWRDNKIMQLWLGGAQLGRLDIARHFCDLEIL